MNGRSSDDTCQIRTPSRHDASPTLHMETDQHRRHRRDSVSSSMTLSSCQSPATPCFAGPNDPTPFSIDSFHLQYAQKSAKRVTYHDELIICQDDDQPDHVQPPDPALLNGTYADQLHYYKLVKEYETKVGKPVPPLPKPAKVDASVSHPTKNPPAQKHLWEMTQEEYEHRTHIIKSSSQSLASPRTWTPIPTVPASPASTVRDNQGPLPAYDKESPSQQLSTVNKKDEVPTMSPMPTASYSTDSSTCVVAASCRNTQSHNGREKESADHLSQFIEGGLSPSKPVSQALLMPSKDSQLPLSSDPISYETQSQSRAPAPSSHLTKPILPPSSREPTPPPKTTATPLIPQEPVTPSTPSQKLVSPSGPSPKIVTPSSPSPKTVTPSTPSRLEQRRAAQISSQRNTKQLSSFAQSTGTEYAWDNQVEIVARTDVHSWPLPEGKDVHQCTAPTPTSSDHNNINRKSANGDRVENDRSVNSETQNPDSQYNNDSCDSKSSCQASQNHDTWIPDASSAGSIQPNARSSNRVSL
ncbi:hypothetical protein SeMB42_g07820 [Synchytrium endobioticum]|uniref:Uncharacterized protein n=1 Tax=Synchytrium endobioticum TaxID=286115 RepID=A0A507BV41_9FUNG|nr:hypothetical protein SeMB42_g07820 [Synchytrium endobioticum]